MRRESRSRVGQLALAATAIGVTVAGLAGCATTSTENSIASDQRPVAAAEPTPSPSLTGPDSLAIARERLTTLLAEQQTATQDRTRTARLIADLKASPSCQKQTKQCEKKLGLLADERDRLDVRIEQLPRAIYVVQTRISQLQPN